MSTRRLLTLMALLAVLATSACTAESHPQQTVKDPARPSTTASAAPTPSPSPIKGISSYVALGDSYTSGPGIARQQKDGGLCFRSDHNYASDLAKILDVRSFKDASCAGATTTNVLNGAAHPVRGAADAFAQVASVKRSTSLVTVGIGGNDSGLFSILFQTCSTQANKSQDVCGPFIASRLPQILKLTKQALTHTLEAVKASAPKARVILVGYLRLAPTTKGCPTFPVSTNDLPAVVSAERALDTAMESGAKDAGVEYVSMHNVSAGHDACAGAKAWTNGATAPTGDGFPLHPNAAGMRAAAQEIRSRLS